MGRGGLPLKARAVQLSTELATGIRGHPQRLCYEGRITRGSPVIRTSVGDQREVPVGYEVGRLRRVCLTALNVLSLVQN